jgi:hypothetical protein
MPVPTTPLSVLRLRACLGRPAPSLAARWARRIAANLGLSWADTRLAAREARGSFPTPPPGRTAIDAVAAAAVVFARDLERLDELGMSPVSLIYSLRCETAHDVRAIVGLQACFPRRFPDAVRATALAIPPFAATY